MICKNFCYSFPTERISTLFNKGPENISHGETGSSTQVLGQPACYILFCLVGSCRTVHRPKLRDKCHTANEVLEKGCPYAYCSADMFELSSLFFQLQKKTSQPKLLALEPVGELGLLLALPMEQSAPTSCVSTQSFPSFPLWIVSYAFVNWRQVWQSSHLSKDFRKHRPERLTAFAGGRFSGPQDIPPCLMVSIGHFRSITKETVSWSRQLETFILKLFKNTQDPTWQSIRSHLIWLEALTCNKALTLGMARKRTTSEDQTANISTLNGVVLEKN